MRPLARAISLHPGRVDAEIATSIPLPEMSGAAAAVSKTWRRKKSRHIEKESGGKRATVEVVVEVLTPLEREMRECQENTPEWLQRVSASTWLLDETDKAGNLLAVVTRFKREVGHTLPRLDAPPQSHRPGM